MVIVRWACDHPAVDVVPDREPPACPICHERRIVSVRAPAPTVRVIDDPVAVLLKESDDGV